TNFNGSENRVGSAQKPSTRPYSSALPGLRSNAYVGVPGSMDRPRTTIARSETAQRFSPGVLEHTGQRWREDAEARLSVIVGPNERLLDAARRCAQRAAPQPSQVSRPHGPSRNCGRNRQLY